MHHATSARAIPRPLVRASISSLTVAVLLGLLLPGSASAQDSAKEKAPEKSDEVVKIPPRVDLSKLTLRPLGPAAMGGRVVALAIDEARSSKYYVGTASGGLWKTVNNGTTFTPLFQNEKVVSIGDVAIDPSNSEHVWIGTGEANNRNSTSWGNGVYFSKDGGKSWKHMGLEKTRHIGRVAVNPKDPSIVFVAACGDLWGPNPERGLYRSKDGGKSWDLVLEKDERTGATDVILDPEDPSIVYCALYERQRDAFDGNHPLKRWGPGSGLYKSTDGGDSWTQMTKGLPTCDIGRVTFDIYRKDPRYVYALIETEKIGTRPEGAPAAKVGRPGSALMGIGAQGEDVSGGAKMTQVTQNGPSWSAGLRAGDVVIELAGEGTTSYAEMLEVLGQQKANDKQELVVLRDGKVKRFEITFGDRNAQGGRGGNSRTPFADRIGGQVANRGESQGPNGFECGGLYMSKDRGETWERINSLNPRPYYFSQFAVDPSDNNNIYVCGIQFHWSFDGGKTFRQRSREITMQNVHVDYHGVWVDPKDGKHLLLACDGGVNVTYDRCKNWETFENLNIGQAYHAVADTRRPYWVYSGYQDNGSWGSPSATRRSEGITNADAFKIGSGDGFVCRVDPEDPNVVYYESQGGNMGWRNLVTGARGRIAKQRDRNWNWNTPFHISPWNAKTLYYGGSKLYKSPNRGRNAVTISPTLIRPVAEGVERSTRASISTISESTRKPGILWAGTDDGKLWVTKDDGRNWEDRSKALLSALPGDTPRWISDVHASHHKDGRAYVAVDGHRNSDRETHIYVTEDWGASWKSLTKGLPSHAGNARVIRDDRRSSELLFAGCEMGLWISFDRGAYWQRMDDRFPTVAVHDFDTQEREQHLIVATHGRGVWALDIRPLRALTKRARERAYVLIKPNDVLRLSKRNQARQGDRYFRLANPVERAELYYHLGENTEEDVRVTVEDALGKTVFEAKGKKRAGLHRVDWNLRVRRGGVAGAARRMLRRRAGARAPAGVYAVTLHVGEKSTSQVFKLEDASAPMDVSWPPQPGVGTGMSYEAEVQEREERERRTAGSEIR